MYKNLPDFERAHILVIGDVMLDRYWEGTTSRISPEAPVPIVKVNNIHNKLGGAANVALNLSELGCKTTLLGIVGEDSQASSLRELLNQSGIEHELQVDKKNPTITKLRVMSQHQQLIRLDFEETQLQTVTPLMQLNALSNVKKYDVVVLSDYAKGTLSKVEDIIAICKANGIPVLVDPKGNNFSRYRGATILTPNRKELELIVGPQKNLDDLFIEAEKLRVDLAINGLIVTLGEHGMALLQEKQAPQYIAAQAREVFDVTGAGDTVIATLAAAIACRQSMDAAMQLANLAASIVVGKSGTATVSKKELIEADSSANKYSANAEFMTLDALIKAVQHARTRGDKIVFTNGCFDILHAGHVRYLQQAAELGQKLIVAINSDASVTKLKGTNRPLNTLENRMEVLASLACIDWVISFDEETPLQLIEALAPDVLVKGGDYLVEDLVGYDSVKNRGGEVVVMPFHQNLSTSSLIKKIQS